MKQTAARRQRVQGGPRWKIGLRATWLNIVETDTVADPGIARHILLNGRVGGNKAVS